MSFTKEWLDRIEQERRKIDEQNRAQGCGCHFDWNDRIEVFCVEHQEAALFEQWKEERDFHDAMLQEDEKNGEIAEGVFF